MCHCNFIIENLVICDLLCAGKLAFSIISVSFRRWEPWNPLPKVHPPPPPPPPKKKKNSEYSLLILYLKILCPQHEGQGPYSLTGPSQAGAHGTTSKQAGTGPRLWGNHIIKSYPFASSSFYATRLTLWQAYSLATASPRLHQITVLHRSALHWRGNTVVTVYLV